MTRLRSYAKKVACLETYWDDLTDKSSVLPLLQMIEAREPKFRYVHRQLLTVEELKANLDLIGKAPSYQLIYLAFHGTPGAISVGDDVLPVEDLAVMMGNRFAGRILHFGTCSTLRCAPERIQTFLEETGVAAVTGYERTVDWTESAAFELLYYHTWNEYVNPAAFKARMLKDYGELGNLLGFACHFRQ